MADERPRRPGYIIFKADGTMDARVFSLPMSKEVRREFDQISEAVVGLRPLTFAAQMALLNADAVNKFVEASSHAKPMASLSKKIGIDAAFAFQIDACRHIANFLSTFRAFLDHSDVFLCCSFGQNSEQRNRFKAATKAQYDGKFSYRFLYKLRNYSQHFALPVGSLNLNHAMDHATGQFRVSSKLSLGRAELLEWSKWGAMRVEIEALSENVEVLPIISETKTAIRELCGVVFGEREAELSRFRSYIQRMSQLVKLPVGANLVVFVGERAGPNLPPNSMEIPPIEEMRLLLKTLGAPL